jgi:broad specificity phosphatase PhoE
MTGFLLIRHTAHDLIATTIAGRMPGVHLNQGGVEHAERLAEQLSTLPITSVFSGPLERARETAAPLARRLNLPLGIAAELDEVETGQWTGKTFEELGPRLDWQNWNAFRSQHRAPGGESMLEVQSRAVGKLRRMSDAGGLIAIFSHGDVIRAVAAYFLGVPLDLFLRIAIDPGSITFLQIYDSSVLVKCVNAAATDAIQRWLG